jgi:hypothetical protein
MKTTQDERALDPLVGRAELSEQGGPVGVHPPVGRETADAETWVCGHTRRCGWSGGKRELVWVPDKRWNFNAKTGTCPKCGGSEFYRREHPRAANIEKLCEHGGPQASANTGGSNPP